MNQPKISVIWNALSLEPLRVLKYMFKKDPLALCQRRMGFYRACEYVFENPPCFDFEMDDMIEKMTTKPGEYLGKLEEK